MRHRRLNTSHQDYKISEHRNTIYIVCLGNNDRCAEIALSGQQNAEFQHNETLEK